MIKGLKLTTLIISMIPSALIGFITLLFVESINPLFYFKISIVSIIIWVGFGSYLQNGFFGFIRMLGLI